MDATEMARYRLQRATWVAMGRVSAARQALLGTRLRVQLIFTQVIPSDQLLIDGIPLVWKLPLRAARSVVVAPSSGKLS